jgi:hypothetical protein
MLTDVLLLLLLLLLLLCCCSSGAGVGEVIKVSPAAAVTSQ